MPDIVLHDLDGLPLGVLRIPAFEHPPRAVIYGGEVYVDLTRNKRDYYQVTVYDVPLTREQNLAVMDAAMSEEEQAGERVAGAYTKGSGV